LFLLRKHLFSRVWALKWMVSAFLLTAAGKRMCSMARNKDQFDLVIAVGNLQGRDPHCKNTWYNLGAQISLIVALNPYILWRLWKCFFIQPALSSETVVYWMPGLLTSIMTLYKNRMTWDQRTALLRLCPPGSESQCTKIFSKDPLVLILHFLLGVSLSISQGTNECHI